MTMKPSNELVPISIDSLASVTGGTGRKSRKKFENGAGKRENGGGKNENHQKSQNPLQFAHPPRTF